MSKNSFKKDDLYVFDLPDEFIDTLEVVQFDTYRNEIEQKGSASDPNRLPKDAKKRQIPIELKCKVCVDSGVKLDRSHYQTDIHILNIKRSLNGLPPVNETEYSALIKAGVDENSQDNGSSDNDSEDVDKSEEESQSEDEELDKIEEEPEKVLNKLSLSEKATSVNIMETSDEDSQLFHLNTGLPQILFKSTAENNDHMLGIFKVLFNKDNINDPMKAIHRWNDPEVIMTSVSAVFVVGGGHFAGAIVSHQRRNAKTIVRTKKNDLSINEQCVQFLEHKTFHRYTTRRKQGGSQSAMDNAKGKANSAGSTLRRYNEVALKTDIQNLLQQWKQYLDKCENIYIRARSSQDKKIFIADGLLNKDDSRIKGIPFTTNRPTVGELRKIWCELTYLKEVSKPQPIKKEEDETKPKQNNQKKDKKDIQKELTEEEKHTEEVITLLKKSRAPLLIAYLRKNKLDPNFILMPETKYSITPTMLHFASNNGLKQMVTILLTTIKCDPTIKNELGKTAWDLTRNVGVQHSFQKARYSLGEEYTNWEEAHVGEPLSKEQIEEMERNKDEKEKLERQELMKKELEHVKELQRQEKAARIDEIELRRGKGSRLNSANAPGLMKVSEQNLNSLSEDQKRRLMREQRARAAEARMMKNMGK
ncbi:Vms1p RNJ42_02767 [Nakaseomyces bracarensis]|uniref:Vms1p n=1 Tax=Nakaseomyces bracarensis TaxID=273131 RepID=UPI0038715255